MLIFFFFFNSTATTEIYALSLPDALPICRSRDGTDLMAASEVELVDDFAARIRQGREQKGWDQRTLALRMKERINEVKRAESGHRPADKVLTKFERSLDIVLMEAVDGGHERNVKRSTPRTLNLGDILDAAKREKD